MYLTGWVNEARIDRGALSPDAIRSICQAGAVPEPSFLALAAIGAFTFALRRRHCKD